MAMGPTVSADNASQEVAPDTAHKAWLSAPAAYWALFVIIFATFMSFLDQVVFGMLAENIKRDFNLTDSQLGFLAGPATIICYFFVGIPLARLADIYPRKLVLAASSAVVGLLIGLSGIAQSFGQFIGTRVFLAAGGSAHAPASYSLLADAFPPHRHVRAFALLQLGFIGGTTLGPVIGGRLVTASDSWAARPFLGLEIFSWQWLLIYLALPSILAGILFLTIREPQRLAPRADGPHVPEGTGLGRRIITFMGFDAARAIKAGRRVYYPMFGALALSSVESFGILFWRTPYLMREFGWSAQQIGDLIGPVALASSIAGLLVGGRIIEWLLNSYGGANLRTAMLCFAVTITMLIIAYLMPDPFWSAIVLGLSPAMIGGWGMEWLAKRYKDAHVRAATICFAGTTAMIIIALLIPDPFWSTVVFGLAPFFAISGAVPQNAAIQRVAPNDMRGQVTAFYLFMFTFFGAFGSWFIGVISDHVTKELGNAILFTACTILPLAVFLMYRAIKPYREEVERLEALGI